MLKNKMDWAWAVFFDIMLGITVLLPSRSIRAEPDAILAMLPEQGWGIILVLIGGVRVAALLINGHWSSTKTALIRGVAAALSAAFWALIFYIVFGFAIAASEASGEPLANFWTSGTSLFLAIPLGNLFCCINAGYDYGLRRKPKVVASTQPQEVATA